MLVAIKVKNLIDGVNDNVIHNKVVRIKNGIIYEIIDSDNFIPINNENVFDYENETIMPGMVDVHVHLAYSGITLNAVLPTSIVGTCIDVGKKYGRNDKVKISSSNLVYFILVELL